MAIWPTPKYFEHGDKYLWLDPLLRLEERYPEKEIGHVREWYRDLKPISFNSRPLIRDGYPRDFISSAFDDFRANLMSNRLVSEKFCPPSQARRYKATIESIIVSQDFDIRPQCMIPREVYSIQSMEDGFVRIQIVHAEGALRAFQTLRQLFFYASEEKAMYTPHAPFNIRDAPTFEHRGLHLDISQNRISPVDAKRTIKAMSFNKMNTLHLHRIDSSSWPIEIPSVSSLAKKDGFEENGVWNAQDLEVVTKYGLSHGVTVYPEVDPLGYTASTSRSQPGLSITWSGLDWPLKITEAPDGQLQLKPADVPPSLTASLSDFLDRTVPFSSVFHVGGREIDLKAWNSDLRKWEDDDTIPSSLKKSTKPLLQNFMSHIISLIPSYAMTPIIWEDEFLEQGIDVPSDVTIQTWKSAQSLGEIVAQDRRALFGPCEKRYLDRSPESGTFIEPNPRYHPRNDWYSPYNNWRNVISFEPLKDIPKEKRHLVVGGEVHLWGKFNEDMKTSLDKLLWPRAAEVLWNGKGNAGEETRKRLGEFMRRLIEMNIDPGWV
ncbi:Glucosamine-6-phosphate isomerase (Glucosamine-6-phosphate deaminase) (GNPDA) (GlcN6P deaminase) [Lecanora helva]